MLAQRLPHAHILGLEPEPDAYQEACENMAASPFAARLSVRMEPLQQHQAAERYDLIVSNPPYFAQHLLGKEAKKNKALHALTLSLEELAKGLSKHLSPHGLAYVILPAAEMAQFREVMRQEGFTLLAVPQPVRPSRQACFAGAWALCARAQCGRKPVLFYSFTPGGATLPDRYFIYQRSGWAVQHRLPPSFTGFFDDILILI
ncbi:methyltransferase [Nitritalea halalkaliphila]|nr:methyltransferase [Nitritalea halalkaliphila]